MEHHTRRPAKEGDIHNLFEHITSTTDEKATHRLPRPTTPTVSRSSPFCYSTTLHQKTQPSPTSSLQTTSAHGTTSMTCSTTNLTPSAGPTLSPNSMPAKASHPNS